MNKINKRLLKVLLISRDIEISETIDRLTADFQEKRCEVDRITSYRAALKTLKTGGCDVCLIDYDLGRQTGFKLLHEAILQGSRTPLILLTGEAEEKIYIEAMRTGAACCLTKGKIDAPLLEQAIGYAVERVGSLMELRGNMDKFRNLVETLPVMIYAAEPQPPYSPIYVSPAFAAFGYSLEEWNSSKDVWMRLLHPEDSDRILKETDRMMNAGRETDLEYRVIAKDGAVHWVHDRGHFVRDEKGKPICWQGVILDITSRKLAEAESKRRGELYSTLAQNIPHTSVLIFDKDLRYSIAEVLPAHKYDFNIETMEGKTLWEVFSPEICAVWENHYRRALDGETVSVERERDGRYFQSYVVPVKNDDGEVFAGMVLWQDITKRKKAEKALRDSEAQFKSTFEDAAVGMAITSLDGRWMQVNQQLCEMLGYERSDLINHRFAEITHPDDIQEDFDSRVNFLSGKAQIFQREKRFIHKNGNIIWGYLSVSMVCDEYDKPSHFIAEIQDITERKHAVEALRESEARYRDIFENANDLIYIHDLKGNYLSINKATERVIGYTLEEALKLNMRQVVAPEHFNYSRRRLADKLAGGAQQTIYETDCITKDGRRVTLEINSSAIYNDGKVVAVQGIARDVTERKLNEQRIQRSEAQMQAVFSAMTDIVMVFDSEGRYLKISQSNPHLSYSPAIDLVGKKLHEIFPASLADYFLTSIRQTLKTRQSVKMEYNLKTGAEEYWFAAVVSPMMTDSAVVVARDISESKRAEKVLKEREEQYRELFENANDIIYTRDINGKFTSLNRAGEIVTGYTREEFLQMTIGQILAPDCIEKARAMVAKENSDEPSPVYELVILSKHGERIPIELSTRLIFKDGNPVGVQGIARDITERQRAEMFLQSSEAQLKDLFDNAPTGYHEIDRDGRIVRINRTELEMLGYKLEEVIGRYAWEFVVETTSRESLSAKLDGKKKLVPMERTFRRKDGSSFPVMLRDTLIRDENGTITGIRANVQDITEQKKAEQALKDSEQKYRLLGEGIMHQIWTAQPNGKINYVNWRTLEYFGKTYSETFGDEWQTLVHPEDLAQSVETWTHSLKTGEDYLTEFRLRRHDGKYFWFQARGVAGRDADGNIVSWFGTNTDIDDRKKAEAKLKYFAGHDTLTNLPNRARFMNYLTRAVKRAEHNPGFRFAVLFLDLDRFKIINDSLGHSIGDKLLLEIAERLEECVRPHDVVARLGGDEFTVLLTRINDPADVVRVADRFLEKLSAPFNLDNYEVFTSASIGIILSDDVPRQPEDFLRDADTAMYRAKAAGKSRYEIFDREMHIRNMNLLQMENDLRKAIEQNEFRVFYQPIIELATGNILEFEALIRWQHPQHGMVAPNDFIGIAEETGLIIPIGRWILEESCRQTAEWQKRFPKYDRLSISVNLSAKQLLHPTIMAQVKEILEKIGFDPLCLKLEVTESMVMENGDKALSVISELTKLGISLSTDDFGTGYSSLSYLHRFPFNRLKIDRSFVSKMDSDQKSEAIVRTILLLAQNLNIEVVAEGIETETQLRSLRQHGCLTGQGYFFSKPVTAEAAAQLLQNGLPRADTTPLYTFGETKNQQLLEFDKVQ